MTVWPFTAEAVLSDRSGAQLASGRGSWWPNGQTSGDAGERYDFGGVLEPGFADELVGKQNRILTFGTDEFRVETSTFYPTLNYVEVGLVKVAANG